MNYVLVEHKPKFRFQKLPTAVVIQLRGSSSVCMGNVKVKVNKGKYTSLLGSANLCGCFFFK